MSNLPTPFQHENLPTLINSSPNKSSSPGFLMLTRPAQASIIGPDGRGRSMGRVNYKPNHRNNSYSNSFRHNQNRSFDNYYKGQTNNTTLNNHFQRSPSSDYMSKSYSFSSSPSFHSTPYNYQRNTRRQNIFHQRSGSNNSKQRFEKPPLKDVPIDKFISLDMVQDPWEEFHSSSYTTGSKVTSSHNDGIDTASSNINVTANDTIDSIGIGDENTFESSSIDANSFAHLYSTRKSFTFESSSIDANSLAHLFSPKKEAEIKNDSHFKNQ